MQTSGNDLAVESCPALLLRVPSPKDHNRLLMDAIQPSTLEVLGEGEGSAGTMFATVLSPAPHVTMATQPKTADGTDVPSSTGLVSNVSMETIDNRNSNLNISSNSNLLSCQLSSSQMLLDQTLSCRPLQSQPSLNQLVSDEPSDNQSACQSFSQSSSRQPSSSRPSGSESKVVEMLKAEVERLKKELSGSKEIIAKMQEREKALRNRLSEQAQRQLQKGSSKFEDLTLGESRPTQLIKRFGNLYTESRLDAMDALDDVPNMADCEDLKVKLLLSIVVLAFRSAEKTLTETKHKIRELLHIPRVMESGSTMLCNSAKEVEESVAFYLRKTVNKHDVSKNFKEVCERVWLTLYDYPMLKECQGLLKYIDENVRIAWALTVQNPPFVIDYESTTFSPETHSRFHTSDAESSAIKSVLWPMLLEGERGPCVAKGVVLT